MSDYYYVAASRAGSSKGKTAPEAIQECCLETAGYAGMNSFWENTWSCFRIPGVYPENKVPHNFEEIEGAVIVHSYNPEDMKK